MATHEEVIKHLLDDVAELKTAAMKAREQAIYECVSVAGNWLKNTESKDTPSEAILNHFGMERRGRDRTTNEPISRKTTE